jgi:hypothetical protein
MNRSSLCRRHAGAVLAVSAGWLWGIGAGAADGLQPAFRLDLTERYPQLTQNAFNSPIFHAPAPGTLVMIQGQCVYGGPPTAVVSHDQGRTWSPWTAFSTWPNRPYADVVHHGGQLLAFTLEARYLDGTDVWFSQDDGVTWTGGSRMVEGAGRWVPMNQRALVTAKGRVILPIDVVLGVEGPGPDNVGVLYSDDAGRTWQRSPFFGPPPPLPTAPEGYGEPACVELADGRIWMVFRALGGHLGQAWSADGGATWGPPSATTLISPLSAVNAKRIPGSAAVVVCWDQAQPGTGPDFASRAFPRTPLVFAVSHDNCQTWSQPVVVDSSPQAIYPSLYLSEQEMFVGYLTVPPGANPAGGAHCVLAVYDLQAVLACR